jgi:uncharacterized protein DUF3592
MFTELVYKWRAIDKWPEATATVTSTEIVSEGGRSGRTMNVFFSYPTLNRSIESGKLFVDDYSSIYGLAENDTFPIQYNANKPSHFYCKEAKSLSSDIRLVFVTIGAIFFIFVILVQVLDHIKR